MAYSSISITVCIKIPQAFSGWTLSILDMVSRGEKISGWSYLCSSSVLLWSHGSVLETHPRACMLLCGNLRVQHYLLFLNYKHTKLPFSVPRYLAASCSRSVKEVVLGLKRILFKHFAFLIHPLLELSHFCFELADFFFFINFHTGFS